MRIKPGKTESACSRAFTLIELILVLALLAIVTSMAAPSLSQFFRGRTLNSEARQMLSLTRAAQSRAVSAGFPMLLWIDSAQHAYGLQEEGKTLTGNAQDVDPKAEQFDYDSSVQIEALNASPVSVNGRSVSAIRFLPDGTADESSPTVLRLTAQNGQALWLIQMTNRANYEIRDSDK
jgi:type II secretion system protein H